MLSSLLRIAGLCKDYCGILNEEAIRLNFVLIYELLDEVLVSMLMILVRVYMYVHAHGMCGVKIGTCAVHTDSGILAL